MSTLRLPVTLPMVCVCDANDRVAADTRRAGICHDFGVPESELFTAIVHDLNIFYSAHISDIYCDQWIAVVVKRSDGSLVSVECDRVEDGIAAIWRWFYENEKREE